jgi:hypothetical protein
MSERIGILKVVAKSYGLILEGENGAWINPDKFFKTKLAKKEKELQDMRSHNVQINFNDEGYYTSIVDLVTLKSLSLDEEVDHGITPEAQKVADHITGKNNFGSESPKEIKEYAKKTAEELKIKSKPSYSGIKMEDEKVVDILPGASKIYDNLNHVQMLLEKKGKFNYASWSDIWDEIKKAYPLSNFKVYENENGLPYFYNNIGGMVKVGVTIEGLEHICWLPILNHVNKSIPADNITSFDVNTSIMR